MKVFYNENQNVVGNESYSPSAGKPALVVEAWQKTGLPIEIVSSFLPASTEDLYKVHSKGYVDGVLSLQKPNGFGNRLPQVASALPWVCGSMVAAALSAEEEQSVAFSPTSGAHHACYSHGGGFCTFNFLILAALALRAKGVTNIAIVDCDMHYGNGCTDIIRALNLNRINYYHGFTGMPRNEDDWLEEFRKRVAKVVTVNEHIIYNAGADCHIDDPLGGALTSEGMCIRDWTLFSHARMLGRPVSVSIAGGYQEDINKVVDLHVQTLFEADKSLVYDHGWGRNGGA